ncbi:hypothetical protein DRE_02730 [Drechslerella stenobrocha 248]|uniref:Autophagy-related protein n=1 Tax=Drechslerella stenobrocha 248 TaxID=1043628 RepID=W7I6K3_9PEZI|nr:hypothetical protein DRE_02730 [Drechslerella stenobrocha 248]
MSRAVDLLASKLPKPRTPLGQRVREILPIGAHVPLHAALTYLFAICLFSITFLVFLNSVLSFVVTDLFDIHDGVGSIVGTLGFVDELVAVFMVILWGGLSDRIGTRLIAASGYFLVGLAFIAIVHVRTVYPGLLLARVLFSMGASATVVSVTAVLPEISTLSPNLTATPKPGQHQNTPADPPERPSLSKSTPQGNQASSSSRSDIAGPSSSTSTTSTLAPPSDPSRPAKWRPPSRSRSRQQQKEQSKQIPKPITGTLSGLVGLMTGCGALIALVFFLPLPAKLSKDKHMTQTEALRHTFYAVAVASWAVALAVFIGLRGQGVGGKTWEFWKPNQFALFARLRGEGDDHDASGRSRPTCDVEAISEPGPTNHEHPSSPDERSALLQASSTQSSTEGMSSRPNRHHYDTVGPSAITTEHYGGHPWTKVVRAYFQGLWLAFKAGGEDWRIGLGYLGGFVARYVPHP